MIQKYHSWTYIQEQNKCFGLKKYMHPNIHNSAIYNGQYLEAA